MVARDVKRETNVKGGNPYRKNETGMQGATTKGDHKGSPYSVGEKQTGCGKKCRGDPCGSPGCEKGNECKGREPGSGKNASAHASGDHKGGDHKGSPYSVGEK